MKVTRRLFGMPLVSLGVIMCGFGFVDSSQADSPPVSSVAAATPAKIDRTGGQHVGKASFYAKQFAGKKMADGTPMQPQENIAASKTLPLGTTALVKNLDSGRTAIVTIRDRGPYVKDRIVDLSPATAREIGLQSKQGVAKVEVSPITVPQPDGSVKLGVLATASKHEATGDWRE